MVTPVGIQPSIAAATANFRWSPTLTVSQVAALPPSPGEQEREQRAVQAHAALLKLSLALAAAARAAGGADMPLL